MDGNTGKKFVVESKNHFRIVLPDFSAVLTKAETLEIILICIIAFTSSCVVNFNTLFINWDLLENRTSSKIIMVTIITNYCECHVYDTHKSRLTGSHLENLWRKLNRNSKKKRNYYQS